MHFTVPIAGAVLNPINTRLDAKNIATILRHSEAKIFFVDYEYIPIASVALRLLVAGSKDNSLDLQREDLEDEWDAISLNYTSGTTSDPKGVVTHMCCAPVVLNIHLEAQPLEHCKMTSKVNILTSGVPPPVPLLEKMEDLGFDIMHTYGLTEAIGPALVCEWQSEWNQLPRDQQARLKARQGVSIITLADINVKNKKTMNSVPHDGKTMGEIVLRGSSIMKGYLKDKKATVNTFQNGWLLTGDVGVIHPDRYVEIKDRSKDVIISGGENISSVELELVLFKHPAILEAAVVAMPHPRWGERPCAFVVLNSTGDVTETEIFACCTKHMRSLWFRKRWSL
ncbi:hypothetical protein L1987_18461 [Smallanthus sonchifolius]|uniref:Uncharacterized protein n=1 Tax=Smallanthus sonchifolius TaxID=185202 RepID=A0ACB9J1S7_9ASTR|nr:hypothetical protein L1987_18461 [Smallanthus sonchifolius]